MNIKMRPHFFKVSQLFNLCVIRRHSERLGQVLLNADGGDDDVDGGLGAFPGLDGAHLADDIHAGHDLSEDDVLAIQPGGLLQRDKELRRVRVLS